MTLTQYAIENPEAFLALVARLRSAGVVKLGALVLGPPQAAPHVTREVDPNAEARRRHNVLFAASRIRPPFEPSDAPGTEPKMVMQRRASEEANGPQKSRV